MPRPNAPKSLLATRHPLPRHSLFAIPASARLRVATLLWQPSNIANPHALPPGRRNRSPAPPREDCQPGGARAGHLGNVRSPPSKSPVPRIGDAPAATCGAGRRTPATAGRSLQATRCGEFRSGAIGDVRRGAGRYWVGWASRPPPLVRESLLAPTAAGIPSRNLSRDRNPGDPPCEKGFSHERRYAGPRRICGPDRRTTNFAQRLPSPPNVQNAICGGTPVPFSRFHVFTSSRSHAARAAGGTPTPPNAAGGRDAHATQQYRRAGRPRHPTVQAGGTPTPFNAAGGRDAHATQQHGRAGHPPHPIPAERKVDGREPRWGSESVRGNESAGGNRSACANMSARKQELARKQERGRKPERVRKHDRAETRARGETRARENRSARGNMSAWRNRSVCENRSAYGHKSARGRADCPGIRGRTSLRRGVTVLAWRRATRTGGPRPSPSRSRPRWSSC